MPKQAVLPCRVSEECRQRLCTLLSLLLFLGMICGAVLIGVGIYIGVRIRDKVTLIENYDMKQLPITLMGVGAATMILNMISVKIVGLISDSSRREKLRSVMLGMVVILTIVDVVLLVAAIMAYVQGSLLTKSFHRGLLKAMRVYKDDIAIKAEIDLLQMEFGCCGNDGYEDWFAIQWVNDEYLNSDSAEVQSRIIPTSGYVNDDTPFSCCHPRSIRPCIHHNIHDNAAHYRYDYERSYTIHRTGCKHRLMDYFHRRLSLIGSGVLGLFSLQLLTVIAAQYLNSSICNALDRGDPERTAKGWMFEEFPLVTIFKTVMVQFIG